MEVLWFYEKLQIYMGDFKTIKTELIVRYFSGECTPGEKDYIEKWRSDSPSNEKVFGEYEQIWNSEYQSLLPGDMLQRDWERIRERINFGHEKQRVSLWKSLYRIAAVILLMVGVSAALYTYWNVPGFGRWNAFQTGDYVDSLQLPDNSVVFLNNHSSLKYLRNFNNGRRTVSLDGEGFFDVATDENNPFRVKTPEGIDLKVLGTSFHVKAGLGINNLELNVTDGVVLLHYQDFSGSVEAGNSAIVKNNQFEVVPCTDNNFLSWKTGEMVFSQDSLPAITRTLESHYEEIKDVRMETRSDVLISTTFRNQSISEVLEELEIHFDKKFQLKDGVLIISD